MLRHTLTNFSWLCATIALALTSCASPKLLLEANADTLKSARMVTKRFYQVYGQDLALKDEPFVTIGVEGGPGYSYDVNHNVLFITPYTHADFDTQRMFAKSAGDHNPEIVYNDLLFNFFTAHQLMHLVYDQLPLAPVSQFEEEHRINTLTWLFLEEEQLLSDQLSSQLEVLKVLEDRMLKHFPAVNSGKIDASGLEVVDNSSYWYVTAVNVQTAYQTAQSVGRTSKYIAGLTGQLAEAEARF